MKPLTTPDMGEKEPIICQICGKEFLTEMITLLHLEVKCEPPTHNKEPIKKAEE